MWWAAVAMAGDPVGEPGVPVREPARFEADDAWSVPVRLPVDARPVPGRVPLPRPARLNPVVPAVGAVLLTGVAASAAWAGAWGLGRVAVPPGRVP